MSRREEYEKQTEELLEPIVAERGFELVDVEYVKEAGNWYLRAYIDKPWRAHLKNIGIFDVVFLIQNV